MKSPRRSTLLAAGALFSAVLLGGPLNAQEEPLHWDVLGERPGEGEVCIVCNQPVFHADVVELRCSGRTFYVAADMLDQFEADPERYFSSLQARSGLFDERAVGEGAGGVRGPWLAVGVYVVAGLVFAALCGYLAIARGHAPLPWFFAGLVGNVAAFGVLLATPRGSGDAAPPGLAKVALTRHPVTCSGCGASNHPAAGACSACGTKLQPAFTPETAKVFP